MSRIDRIFAELRANRRKALMPFVCGGFPRRSAVSEAVPVIAASGASVIEIGLPFSDPIADGPVIAAAMHDALRGGATPATVIDEVASLRGRVDVGLVAMVSVSIVTRLGGADAFCSRLASAGFDGVICPDCPLEESAELVAAAKASGLSLSMLIAPSTPGERARAIARASSGFVYLLARAGITGERSDAPDIAARVAEIRQYTNQPIACGFGVASPEHVRAVVRDADAAIVGSALVRRMGDAGDGYVRAADECVRELATGLV